MGEVLDKFDALREELEHLEVSGQTGGVSSEELRNQLSPIADKLRNIESAVNKIAGWGKPTNPKPDEILRGIETIKDRLKGLENNPNFGALQAQIDYLIGRLSRIEQQAKAQGTRS